MLVESIIGPLFRLHECMSDGPIGCERRSVCAWNCLGVGTRARKVVHLVDNLIMHWIMFGFALERGFPWRRGPRSIVRI